MSVKKLLILSASAGLALASASVLAGGPDNMGPACDAAHVNHGFFFGAGFNRTMGASKTTGNAGDYVTVGSKGWGGQLFAGYDVMLSHSFDLGADAFFNFYNVKTRHADLATVDKVRLNHMYGFAVDPAYMVASNVHIKLRLGGANGDIKVADNSNSNTFNKWGWLVGLGTDVAFTNQLSLEAMFTHYSFGKKTTTTPATTTSPRFGEYAVSLVYHM